MHEFVNVACSCVDEEFYDQFCVYMWSLLRLVNDVLCIESCNHLWTYWNKNKYEFECQYRYRVCGY